MLVFTADKSYLEARVCDVETEPLAEGDEWVSVHGTSRVQVESTFAFAEQDKVCAEHSVFFSSLFFPSGKMTFLGSMLMCRQTMGRWV